MRRAFESYFKSLVKQGSITVDMPGGPLVLGDGTGPDLAIKILDQAAVWALLRNPVLQFGELYMDHRIEVTRGSIYDVLALGSRNILHSHPMDWTRTIDRFRAFAAKMSPGNGLTRSRANVSHHYDLDRRLYALFLDQDWQYSCGYFESPADSLDTAQLAKKRHIAAKLLIEPGHSVLDIGCGWGGMALYLARNTGANVRGITLSKEQLDMARSRVAPNEQGIAFDLEDYRATQGPFDRIVSVGMLEHVGLENFKTYFRRVAELMSDDGVALIHTIGRSLGPAHTNEWLQKYIFPGGYIPALSELAPAIEAAGLFITDVETLRLHYAETVKAWSENFARRRDQARAIYGERFCRMWEFYLAGAESAFREEREVVFQLQLSKKIDTVPLTRAYISEREEALRRIDTPQQARRASGRRGTADEL